MSAGNMDSDQLPTAHDGNLTLVRVLLTAFTLLASLLSFVAYTLLLRSFGASSEIDRLFLASSVPVSVAGFVSGVMVYWLPPILVREPVEHHSGYIRYLSLKVAVVTAIFISVPVVLLLKSVEMGAMQAVFMVISGLNVLGTVMVCIAQAQAKYLKTGIYAAIVSLGLVAGVWGAICLSNIWMVVIGQLCGSFLALVWMVVTLRVQVFSVDGENAPMVFLPAMVSKVFAIALATTAFTLFPAIDALLSTQLAKGSLSIMSYAQKVVVALSTVVSLGAHVIGARRSHDALRTGGLSKLRAETRREVAQIIGFSLLALVAYELIGRKLLWVVLTSASMSTGDVNRLADCLRWMLIGLGPMAAMPYLFRVYYSLNVLTLPAALGAAVVVGYAGVSALLIPYFDVQGLSIAYAAVWWIVLVATTLQLSRHSLVAAIKLN